MPRPRRQRRADRRGLGTGNCAVCGAEYEFTKWSGKFCSVACKDHWWNTAKTRGAQLYGPAMRWRRDKQKGALGELTWLLDQFIHDDREAKEKGK